MSERKNRGSIFLIAAGAVFVFAVIGILAARSRMRESRTVSMPLPYVSEAYLQTSKGRVTAYQNKDPFSKDLCVSEDNTGLEGLSITEGESGALFSLDDRTVLFSRNMYGKIYPASVTKIMTAILVLRHGNLDDSVQVTEEDLMLEEGSQVVGLAPGDTVTVRELLHGLLIHSGNDAAMVLARHVGGSVPHFVEMMNETLKELGATGSHFSNPSGLHDSSHYTTVYDIYLMLNEALKMQEFVRIIKMSAYAMTVTHADGNREVINLSSTDRYLTGTAQSPRDVIILGGKTGTTSMAGHCLALASQNAFGQKYISIIVGARNSDLLYGDMNKLLAQINE